MIGRAARFLAKRGLAGIVMPMMNDNIELVAFDLDDTLAPSKSALPQQMAVALSHLLERVPVCVISGGNLGQFEAQLLDGLSADETLLERLHLMPTCGTQYLVRESGEWVTRYREHLSEDQKRRAVRALEDAARELDLWESKSWGPIIEDRDTQITFSALGQRAPLEAKHAWDPSGEKKRALAARVAPLVPDLEVRGGGSTSIDITAKGVDKAYGMRKLAAETGIPAAKMVFVGDRLDEEGNDYPVKVAGWPTIAVTDWQDTLRTIQALLANPRLGDDSSARADS